MSALKAFAKQLESQDKQVTIIEAPLSFDEINAYIEQTKNDRNLIYLIPKTQHNSKTIFRGFDYKCLAIVTMGEVRLTDMTVNASQVLKKRSTICNICFTEDVPNVRARYCPHCYEMWCQVCMYKIMFRRIDQYDFAMVCPFCQHRSSMGDEKFKSLPNHVQFHMIRNVCAERIYDDVVNNFLMATEANDLYRFAGLKDVVEVYEE